MPTLIALLRGINVGKAKRIAMADLRTIVESLGYSGVRTLLNSGNVVFTATQTAAKAATRIEKALADKTGISARVLVITAAELSAAVKENPLLPIAENPSRLLVAFLAKPADRSKLEPLLKQKWGKEVFAVGSGVAYFWLPEGIIESQLLPAVSRALDNAVTTRNWATVLKLHALSETAD